MGVLGKTAIAAGFCITAMLAGAPAMAGALPIDMAALKAVSPTQVVQAAWGHRGWRRHHRGGFLLGGIAVGGTLNPQPYRYGYCAYFPCPVYEPAYIPYAYYGAPFYRGYYHPYDYGYWGY